MGKRHDAREWAVQFLFQRDFNSGELDDAFQDFWADQDRKASDRMRAFTEDLVRGVEGHRDEIDVLLKRCAEHWDVHRMGAVDRNVMRVALYEMLHCPDIPPVVSINEAVDIAKALSSLESARFVNGILDRALKEVDRPQREAQPPGDKEKD